ncbi:hypothetical protein D187_001188 [Cystobacter fuscus DSM 2262]|uniref:Uncharacterized protein n=1 Tax=Cystobacter fuscus (strain ATCC 25194 / DSM 2262 / NBRC 100088 / M29) TaxID=1242864 RepID=S9PAG4_CYSF2|nr:hypothetical protein D187_001188 [Cystobacter fuscus DSM 2262]
MEGNGVIPFGIPPIPAPSQPPRRAGRQPGGEGVPNAPVGKE